MRAYLRVMMVATAVAAVAVLLGAGMPVAAQYSLNGPTESSAVLPVPPPPMPAGGPAAGLFWTFKEMWLDSALGGSAPVAELPGMSGNGGSVLLASPSDTEVCSGDCDVVLTAPYDKVQISGLTMGRSDVATVPTNFWIFDTRFIDTATSQFRGNSDLGFNIDSNLPVSLLAGLTVALDAPTDRLTINVGGGTPEFTASGVCVVESGSMALNVASATVAFPSTVVSGDSSTVTFNFNAGSTVSLGGIDGRLSTVTTLNLNTAGVVNPGVVTCYDGAEVVFSATSDTWDIPSLDVNSGCEVRLTGSNTVYNLDGSATDGTLSMECSTGTCTFNMGSLGDSTPNMNFKAGTSTLNVPANAGAAYDFSGFISFQSGATGLVQGNDLLFKSRSKLIVNHGATATVDVPMVFEADAGVVLKFTDKAQFATASLALSASSALRHTSATLNGYIEIDVTPIGDQVQFGDKVVLFTHDPSTPIDRITVINIRGWDLERQGNVSYVTYFNDRVEFEFSDIYYPPRCPEGSLDPACRPAVDTQNETDAVVAPVVQKKSSLGTGVIVGIIIAVILFILILAAIIAGFIFYKRRNALRKELDGDADFDGDALDDFAEEERF